MRDCIGRRGRRAGGGRERPAACVGRRKETKKRKRKEKEDFPLPKSSRKLRKIGLDPNKFGKNPGGLYEPEFDKHVSDPKVYFMNLKLIIFLT